jgi:hypothetical protein
MFWSGSNPNKRRPERDSIIPERMYVKGNVRIVIGIVNMFKSNLTDNDMYEVAEAVIAKRELET